MVSSKWDDNLALVFQESLNSSHAFSGREKIAIAQAFGEALFYNQKRATDVPSVVSVHGDYIKMEFSKGGQASYSYGQVRRNLSEDKKMKLEVILQEALATSMDSQKMDAFLAQLRQSPSVA